VHQINQSHLAPKTGDIRRFTMTMIALHIPSVRCVDETGGKWAEKFGNDEIYIGAVYVLINANKSFIVGTTGAKLVGNNFDDGETVHWARDLFALDLGDQAVYPYPKALLASVMLAEHDSGNGRNSFLENLAEEFRKKLTQQAIEGAISARRTARPVRSGVIRPIRGMLTGAGTMLTPTTPAATDPDSSGKEDGFVVSALKDFAKEKLKELGNYLIGKVSSWAGDDIFPTNVKLLDLANENQTWNGQFQTPEETLEFRGHDAVYQVVMRWERR
jgi:hypothetical protein